MFAIVGESGSGKTNEIISLLLQNRTTPSLFYSGTLLGTSFFNDLKFDFNLEFSPQETELTILKKLSSLVENHNTDFISYIDAIDEWTASDKVKQLDNLIKAASRYNIKICISCKDLMWGSFLSTTNIPTILSSNLFAAEMLNEFTESEFDEALSKYSKVLNVAVDSKGILNDYRNPFSMRIAFEVSSKEKRSLELNSFSQHIIELYITQKISKTQTPQRNKRYLIQIAEALLNFDKVHQEERLIRETIHLGINDEIPIELFSNNLLYANSIEDIIYIGFYFSKIRDHIIVNNVLKLNSSESDRTKSIEQALKSYIGENAVNYYLKISNPITKKSCLKSIAYFDKTYHKTTFTKLLAQQSNDFYKLMSTDIVKDVIARLKYVLLNYKNENNLDEEISEIVKKITFAFKIEMEIIDILKVLDQRNEEFDISPQLCRLLTNYDSEEGTKELVKLLVDEQFSERIRRFIIDALSYRDLDNRKEIFVTLLEEQIQKKKGVYYYAKGWYSIEEDKQLRDKLLTLFDHERDGIKDYILHTLMNSQLDDTGSLLFKRFTENTYSENITCWLCRGICEQKYTPAIPTFIKMFQSNPDSELATSRPYFNWYG